jgi:hypothetical protein
VVKFSIVDGSSPRVRGTLFAEHTEVPTISNSVVRHRLEDGFSALRRRTESDELEAVEIHRNSAVEAEGFKGEAGIGWCVPGDDSIALANQALDLLARGRRLE